MIRLLIGRTVILGDRICHQYCSSCTWDEFESIRVRICFAANLHVKSTFLIALALISLNSTIAVAGMTWPKNWKFAECNDQKIKGQPYEDFVKSTILKGTSKLMELNSDFGLAYSHAQTRSLKISCEDIPFLFRSKGTGTGGMYIWGTIYLAVTRNAVWSSNVLRSIVFHEFLHFLTENSHSVSELNKPTADGYWGIEKDLVYSCTATVFPIAYGVTPIYKAIEQMEWARSRTRSCIRCASARFSVEDEKMYSVQTASKSNSHPPTIACENQLSHFTYDQ